jgi:hypothetical protein
MSVSIYPHSFCAPLCLLADLYNLFLLYLSVHVGLRGSFGQQHCNPRTLRSHQIGKMVSLEGIVTRCEFASRTLPQPLAICGYKLTLLLNISPCQTKMQARSSDPKCSSPSITANLPRISIPERTTIAAPSPPRPFSPQLLPPQWSRRMTARETLSPWNTVLVRSGIIRRSVYRRCQNERRQGSCRGESRWSWRMIW